MPHNHKKKIAKFYYADAKLINKAIEVATETQKKWDRTPMSERYFSTQNPDVLTKLVCLKGLRSGKRRRI